MFENIKLDFNAVMQRDAAAKSKIMVWFTAPGFRAVRGYRLANYLYSHNFKHLAQFISQRTKSKTGVEIHPAATIGSGFFIDHGTGVVIGETAEIGTNATIYQGVTLGGTGKDIGKRHPTLGDGVMVCAGAIVLGPVKIGDGAKIGAGSVVLHDVPAHATVVGVPGRVVRLHGKKPEKALDQQLPDPMLEEIARLNKRISTLEDAVGIKACKYSIVTEVSEDE